MPNNRIPPLPAQGISTDVVLEEEVDAVAELEHLRNELVARLNSENTLCTGTTPSTLTIESIDELIEEESVEYVFDVVDEDDGEDFQDSPINISYTNNWETYRSSPIPFPVPRFTSSGVQVSIADESRAGICARMDMDREELNSSTVTAPIVVVFYDEIFVTAILQSSSSYLYKHVEYNTDYDMDDCYTYLLRECPVHTAKIILDFDKGGKPFNKDRRKAHEYIYKTELRFREW